MADIFDVIADPTRRGILQLLRDRLGGAITEVGVTEFVDAIGVTRQSINRHLIVLRDAGLVSVREDGAERWYALDTTPLDDVEEWLGQFVGLSPDATGAATGDGSTVFSAWSGADVGATIGRTIAERSFKTRTVIRDASDKFAERIPDAVRKRVIRGSGQ
jgi:DNA-binding transcriptional ArsR family regulator